MQVDEKEFFREFTLRICGSLEIEKALWQCFLYVKDIMPASQISLSIFDPHLGSIEIVATADEDGGISQNVKTHFPPEIRRQIEGYARYSGVRILDDLSQDKIIGPIAKHFNRSPNSVMIIHLNIEGKFIGSLSVCTEGKQKYTQDHSRLWSLVNEPAAIALANSLRYREVIKLKELLADDYKYLQNELQQVSGWRIIGADGGLKPVMEKVRQVATIDSPVLLLGETGVGKEVVANAIHNLSGRKDNPFIKVNCGAIPETLIDSELFGHEKGAFTGAVAQKRGRFERAHKGTIFLDEIAELPLPAQTRMLRVVQHHEIERVGGEKAIPLDIRIIAATHRNLEEMVPAKQFREDLWFRLNVFPVNIPPLRERKADIPALVQYFIEKKSRELRIKQPPAIEAATIDRLMSHAWPGNIRELENAVERALIENQGRKNNGLLRFDHFAFTPNRIDKAVSCDQQDEFMTLEQATARHIQQALKTAQGKIHGIGGAAELLGINPTTLRSKMDKLSIAYRRHR